MSDIIGIAGNAVAAYQRALGTVSNNIANVNTEGYSRQDVVLKDTAPTKAANMFFGTGVALEAVKRQFDAFAESNLRNSNSDLSSQKPMVDYTKRVMDIMGDKSVGLSSALDDFFTSANALSADPASSVLRSSFLRSSEGVASRFAELSGQFDLVGTETSQALESTTKQVNTLTSQLALVNQNMASSATEDGQSAEILDRRDLILRQLSDLVRIKTSFATNGSVSVALGNTVTQGVVVDGLKSRPIGIDTSVPGKTELVLDPYGKTESLASASGGQLGGLQAFISQVLEPAQKSLNFLAQTLVTETNKIQTNGIDGYGQTGQNLFSIDQSSSNSAAGIKVSLTDAMRVATAAQFRVTENATNTSSTRASVAFSAGPDPVGISNTNLVNNPNPTAGVTIKVDGARVIAPVTTLAAGMKATFYLDDAKPGQQLQVLTRDGRQLLGQTLSETEKYQMLTAQNGFVPNSTYSDAYLNKSGASGYRGMDIFYGAMAKVRSAQVFDRNGVPAPSTTEPAMLDTSRITDLPPGTLIHAGAINLNGIALPDLATQLNQSLSPQDVAAWVNGQSQVAIAAPSFSGFSASFGGVAMSVPNLNPVPNDLITLASDLQTELQAQDGTSNITVSIASNGTDLQIQDALGRSIDKVVLTPTTGALTGGDVTVTSSLTSQTGVKAQAYNDIRVPSLQIDYSKPLKINNQMVISGYKDVNSLVAAINQTPNIGVNASVQQGDLVISAVPSGEPILINPTPTKDGDGNALSVTPMNYTGQVRMVQVIRDLHIPSTNIDYNKKLEINGTSIDISGLSTIQELADKINAQRTTVLVDPNTVPPLTQDVGIGVKASIGFYGDLVLSTTDANGSAAIAIGPPKNTDGTYEQNALGLEPIDYTVQDRLKLQLAEDPTKSSIRFSFGTYGDPPKTGSPADLSKAGLRTGAYIEGGSQDDLLVFVTGQGKSTVAASYHGTPLNMRDNLRSQSLVVKFTATDRYTISDAKTGTQLADRHYDPSSLEPTIDFEGLQIKLNHAPNVGDSFQVDGNQDGLGNNVNMLDMVDLAKKPVVNGKTLANTYIDQINNVGNLAQQASITQQALTVVNNQAIAARDKVSGVNLDEEAAALIRYQQAYQASAKALQISGTLFDSIVQIR
ncbi:MAG: Flagellar hook-associated protein 1 [Pseudomonadota bacterium]|jgi:flagellar hook-associated protein FlgK